MFLADLHIHSSFSDGKHAIPEIVDLYGSRGFGAIAITDHLCESNTMLGKAAVYMNRTLTPAVFPLYMEILRSEAERAWNQYRMVLLPGFELTKSSVINHRSARIIGLGISKYVPADADAVVLAREIRKQGGVAIAGPTHHLWDRREELEPEFDAWEANIGKELAPEVMNSNLPKIVNSGLHSLKHINSWKSVFFCERNPRAILEAIKTQDLCFMLYHERAGERAKSSNNEEKPYDIHDWIDVNGSVGGDVRIDSIRHLAVRKALTINSLSRRRLVSSLADLHTKTAKGQRPLVRSESGELLSTRLS